MPSEIQNEPGKAVAQAGFGSISSVGWPELLVVPAAELSRITVPAWAPITNAQAAMIRIVLFTKGMLRGNPAHRKILRPQYEGYE